MTIDKSLAYNAADQIAWRKRMKSLSFGQTLKAFRLSEDWSLTYAAERIGISKQQLSDYENSRKLPSIEKAYKIANALGMIPESFVLQLINEQLRRAKIPILVKLAG